MLDSLDQDAAEAVLTRCGHRERAALMCVSHGTKDVYAPGRATADRESIRALKVEVRKRLDDTGFWTPHHPLYELFGRGFHRKDPLAVLKAVFHGPFRCTAYATILGKTMMRHWLMGAPMPSIPVGDGQTFPYPVDTTLELHGFADRLFYLFKCKLDRNIAEDCEGMLAAMRKTKLPRGGRWDKLRRRLRRRIEDGECAIVETTTFYDNKPTSDFGFAIQTMLHIAESPDGICKDGGECCPHANNMELVWATDGVRL